MKLVSILGRNFMENKFLRNELLLNKEVCLKLSNLKVLVVGCGGVGGYAIEALSRLGVENFTLVDNDDVDITNFNRQIIAINSNLNKSKVEAFKERLLEINSNISVDCKKVLFNKDSEDFVFDKQYDFVVDAIDTLSLKWELIKRCLKDNLNFISSMGMANKIDLTKVKITTLDKTINDPVSKKLREFARKDKMDLKKIPVIFSSELPFKQQTIVNNESNVLKVKVPPASLIFTPAVAGLLIGQYILEKLCLNK